MEGQHRREEQPVPMSLDETRRAQLLAQVRGFSLEEFDEEISMFRAEQLLDFFLEKLGPPVYNQGVQDARRFLQEKLDDLEGDVYEPEV